MRTIIMGCVGACGLFLASVAQAGSAPSGAVDEGLLAAQSGFSGAGSSSLQEFCDKEFSAEHFINVGGGAQVHVIERFSGRALLRFPRRSILMLPATLATNEWLNADISGDPSYNALHQAASRGFFGIAMSYEGYGESSHPDGRSVTPARLLQNAGKVVEWIRAHRGVPKVDVYGTSIGAGIAMALGGTESPINRHHINRLVISTSLYKLPSPLVQATFTPAFQAFLLGLPNGYYTTTPANYAPLFPGLDPAVLAWAAATLPGDYPVGPTLGIYDLPFFEAAPGRAPLLQFWGSESPTTPLADVELLASEYGGPYELIVFEGAGHAPILEPIRHEFWDETEAFLNEGSGPEISLCDIFDAG